MTDFSSPPPGGDPSRQPKYLPPAISNPQLPAAAHGNAYGNEQKSSTILEPNLANVPLGRIIEPTVVNQDEHWTEALQDAPPWLGSLVIHMLVLIIMGLMVVSLRTKKETPIQATYGDTDKPGEQLLEDNREGLATDTPDPTVDKTIFSPSNLPPVADPLAAPPLATEFSPNGLFAGSTKAIDAPIGLALSGRERGMRRALLGRYGGNATTESAVHAALEWLKRNQRADGYWTLNGPYSDPGEAENKTSATALALLAFQGAGNTHLVNGDNKYDYKAVVKKGWTALLKMQSAEGQFMVENSPFYHQMYSHAQATIALCELYGMTHDSVYRSAAERAVSFCVKSQDTTGGGWRYNPNSDSDTSVTGWFVMALQSAMMAGLEVPSKTMINITRYLDSAQDETGSRYFYQPHGYFNYAMTAEGLLCRQYLGWKRNDPRLTTGVQLLSTQPVNDTDINVYQWYYATQVMHHMGGDYWKKWNEVMRQAVPETQVKKGSEDGSWNPSGDKYGGQGGRLYVTCLRTFMLEVYYRHLPIYDSIYESRGSASPSGETQTDATSSDKPADATSTDSKAADMMPADGQQAKENSSDNKSDTGKPDTKAEK
jgi:hypothetical protein